MALDPSVFEKLGVFYLGRPYDLAAKKAKPGWLLYDSKDLVTHAVCVGMTGSGKTGLCIGLLEEAAIDGIPAIVIDPKGDLANLLLTFPELRGEDLRPGSTKTTPGSKGCLRPTMRPSKRPCGRRAGGMGTERRADSKIARRGGLRRLHAGQHGRNAGVDSQVVRRAVARDARRCRTLRERIGTTVDQSAGADRAAKPIRSRAANIFCCRRILDTCLAGGP